MEKTTAQFDLSRSISSSNPVSVGTVAACDLVSIDLLVLASRHSTDTGTQPLTTDFRVDWKPAGSDDKLYRPIRSPSAPVSATSDANLVWRPTGDGRRWCVHRLNKTLDRPEVRVRLSAPTHLNTSSFRITKAVYDIYVSERRATGDYEKGPEPQNMRRYERIEVPADSPREIVLRLEEGKHYDIATRLPFYHLWHVIGAAVPHLGWHKPNGGLVFPEPRFNYQTAEDNNARFSIRITENTVQPRPYTIRCPLPQPQDADFRVVKVTADRTGERYLDNFEVQTVRRLIDQPPVKEAVPHSSVTDRLRVSRQFNGQLEPLNALAESLIDKYNPTTRQYEPVYSDNMALIGSWLFRTGRNPVRHTHEEELVWLDFADWVTVEGISVAEVIEGKRSTVDEVSEMVAAGFATLYPTGRGTYLPLWRDNDKPVSATLGMNNTWDFERVLITPDLPHALIIRGRDLELSAIEVTHYLDGYDRETATKFESVSVKWLRDIDQLKMYAKRLVQQTLYARAVTKFKMRHAGYNLKIGERITYRVPKFSVDRTDQRIAKVWHDEASGACVKIAFVNRVELLDGREYALRISTAEGQRFVRVKPVSGPTNELELATPLGVDQDGHLVEPGAHFILGRVEDTRVLDLTVVGFERDPQRFGVTTIICKDSAPRIRDGVQQADGRYLIETVETVAPAPPQQVQHLSLTESAEPVGNQVKITITAAWRLAWDSKPVSHYKVIWRVNGRNRLDHITTELSATLTVEAGDVVSCVVVAIGLGPRFDQLPENEAANTSLTVIGSLSVPAAVIDPQITLTETGVEISWGIDGNTAKTDIMVRQPGGVTAPVRRLSVTNSLVSMPLPKAGTYVLTLWAVNLQAARSAPVVIQFTQSRDLVPNEILRHAVDTTAGDFTGDMSRDGNGDLVRISGDGVDYSLPTTPNDAVLFNPWSRFYDFTIEQISAVPLEWWQGPNRETEAGWVSAIIDLGQIVDGTWTTDAEVQVLDRTADFWNMDLEDFDGVLIEDLAFDQGASCEIKIEVGQEADLSDAVTGWSFVGSGRYVRIRVAIEAESELTDVVIKSLNLLVDGPDRVEEAQLTLTSSPQTFPFRKDFAVAPRVITQAINGAVALTEVTADGMTVTGPVNTVFNYRATGV
jgi:hypothetical protein